MYNEDVVVKWIEQVAGVPAALLPLVKAYNVRKQVADSMESYPQRVDDEMNVLYDAMLVLAKEVNS
jgi:hypothetical protein